MAWLGVITNSGNDLLTRWVEGKTLTITRAASGQGRVSETAMMAQTALVNEKQTVSIISNTTVEKGQRLKLQVTPQGAVGYSLNQFGVWARLDNEEAKMIALFQTDTDIGIDIPSKTEMPDFVYTFYGLLAFSNQGTLSVTIDAAAVVTAETLGQAVAAAVKTHEEDEEAHKALFEKKADLDENGKVGTDQLPVNEPGGIAGLDENGKVEADQLPINTPGGIAGLGEDGKMGTGQLPINTPGGIAGLGEDGKMGTGQLPINTPGGIAGLGEDGKMGTGQLPINEPGGIPGLDEEGKISGDFLPSVGMAPQIVVTAPTGSTVTATLGSRVYTATEESERWVFNVEEYGTYTIRAAKGGDSASGTVSVTVVQQYAITLAYFQATIHVTADSGSTVTCTKGGEVQTKTSTGTVDFFVSATGTYTLKATKDGEEAEDTATITADGQTVNVTLAYRHIYGVEWDGTSTTVWSRTDEAAGFANPVPYVAGASSYGSPFDNLWPWSGMVKSTDGAAGALVAIPKFWFKWTKTGNRLKLQIADKATPGFYVSPAHANRGDGKGERETVYIGRYHCHTSNWKSQSGGKPKADITRSAARSGIHGLGATIWQSDIQIRMTLWMLYLVEFADWNSQKTIGKGCGDNSNTGNMGYTDSMPYHTGTTQNSRDTYGLGTQYRNIEGLWDNVYDWGDGCYYNSAGLNIIMNPNNFSDSSGGTAVGVPTSGWPSAFAVATATGLEWCIYPTAANGSETTYSSDYWNFYASSPCLRFGGNYNQSGNRGLFYVYYDTASGASGSIGCRLQKLP